MPLCVALLAAAAMNSSVTSGIGPHPTLYEESTPQHPAQLALPDLTHIAQATLPAVVGVLTTQGTGVTAQQSRDPVQNLFERFHRDEPHKGLGTGFIIHPDGYILTNAHVVEGASVIEVNLGDGDDHFPARVVGTDEGTDIALLKIEARRPLPVVPLGDSDHVQIAEWVMVIGNPFGLDHSVTLGIISQTGRNDIAPAGREGYYDFIQTDASINPGNSGGPLINLRGEVIGIATAINATGQGIGFAIPIDMAKAIVGQLKDHGKVLRSWMGISVEELPRGSLAPAGQHGVLVTDVVAGGPAARSGIKAGDVITAFQGRQIRNAARLRWYVSTAGVGNTIDLTVLHGRGPEEDMRVRLGKAPPPQAVSEDNGADQTEAGGSSDGPSSLGSQN